ncbi:MAG: ADP-forming succinate--CoA ligase subunit beta [Aeromonas sp.]
MNLHEYQAKQLFRAYGLPVSAGYPCTSVAEVSDAADKLGGQRWVIKCQVHAGGRGQAGGVKVAESKERLRSFARHWLGKRLITAQTDAHGQLVQTVLVENCCEIARELYLGAVIDRASQRIVFMASTQGGMAIEQVAHATPELIHRISLDPLVGAQPFQARQLAFKLGLSGAQVAQFIPIFLGLAQLFMERDLSLLEVNPLVVTSSGDLLCLDGKINVDGNALYRQPEIAKWRDLSQEDPREAQASAFELNYVALEGNIGCMVNGAGLAMATMDCVQRVGGAPANFLDVGGGATQQRVVEAFKLILSDRKVRAVLVNIFGGIVRCDMIAAGIIGAVKQVGVKVPVVVRLEGNNSAAGLTQLRQSGLNIIAAYSLREAAEQVVQAAKERV